MAALGFSPVLAPALEIRPVASRLPPPRRFAAVLVTSGNALDSLPADWHATPLLAVGDATAERARAAGFRQVSSASGDATDLAALATQVVPPHAGPLLLASGRGQGRPLAAALRGAGYRVVRRVTYAAVPATSLAPAAATVLRAGEVHAALFFSADTARHFVRLVRRAKLAETLVRVEAITIGKAAAVALGALAWRDIRVAARPTREDMLALLR